MNTPQFRVYTLGLATTMALGFVVPSAADAPAPTRSQSQYEVRFMTGMIDHHAMAVEMAGICLQRAMHEELLQLCEQIRDTQLEEIATMQTWLESWYGVSYAPEMTTGIMRQMERMSELGTAEFEIAFMKSMIRHHWKAVVESAGCLERAHHPELVAMCGDIITAQAAEIEQMRSWVCLWYGICHYGPKGNVAGTH
jgi:uncharacterized protein (DUF305 family)